jgi:hypothetical protein
MNTLQTIYTKDKKVKITFRCDDALSDWVNERAKVIGLTPSAFVRQMLYQQFYAEKTIIQAVNDNTKKLVASTETAAHNEHK